jgi:dihydrodipicolinate synthase/N-acetylneuraminate lyase
MPPLRGIFTPNIVPLDTAGRIDEERLRGYIDWLIDSGVDGLYPNGSTGEFIRFTPEERRQIMRIVVDQAAGRVPILAGAAEANVQETIAACNEYGELGVRAVAIVAPFYYRLAPEGVFAYFKQIADNSRVDITLYNIPMFASPIDVATVKRLALECPRVIGIKDSSGDLPHMCRMIAEVRPIREDFYFLTGWDASLTAMLLVGCDGGTNATSGVVPELTSAIYRAARSGQWGEAMQLQYQLLPIFDLMISTAEFPEGFRRGAKLRGWDLGMSRQPLSQLQLLAAQQAEHRLAELLTPWIRKDPHGARLHGVGEQPELVDRIVREVLAQLSSRA